MRFSAAASFRKVALIKSERNEMDVYMRVVRIHIESLFLLLVRTE